MHLYLHTTKGLNYDKSCIMIQCIYIFIKEKGNRAQGYNETREPISLNVA